MNDEKKFLIPEADIINFRDEEIIVTSGEEDIEGTETYYPGGVE